MPATSHHDVVIVGARPAGAATAMLLARAGLDVVVVEHSAAGLGTLSTHPLVRGGVVQLRRWGVLEAVVAAGTPPIRRSTFAYADDVVAITVKPSYGVDALYAPRCSVLDPILLAAAVDAGAELLHGTTVTGLIGDDHGRVTGIDGLGRDGEPVRCTARWVIGADGVRSVVARDVGAPVDRRGTAATTVVSGYVSDLEVGGYHWIFHADACAGAIPTNDGQTFVFAAATPQRIGAGGVDTLRDVLTAASPAFGTRLAAAPPPTGVRTFSGPPGYVRRAWGPGWALVGDAGSWTDPVGAHGLTDALRDAELLAPAVVDTAGGQRAETAAFDDFHRTRDRLSSAVFDVVDTIAGMRWSDSEIPALLLRLNSALTDEVEALAALPLPPTPTRSTR